MELVDIGPPNLWGHFKDGVLKACDQVWERRGGGEVKEIFGCGMKR